MSLQSELFSFCVLCTVLSSWCRCPRPRSPGQRLRQRSLLWFCGPVRPGRGKKPFKTLYLRSGAVALPPLLIHCNVLLLQSSEHNRSIDDLDEEENHVLPPLEESQVTQELRKEVQGPPQVIRCGGEDGEKGGGTTQRQRLNAGAPDSSLVRRGRGEVILTGLLYSRNQTRTWEMSVYVLCEHVLIINNLCLKARGLQASALDLWCPCTVVAMETGATGEERWHPGGAWTSRSSWRWPDCRRTCRASWRGCTP